MYMDIYVCIDMRVNMCIDMFVDMCIDTCVDMCARHVSGQDTPDSTTCPLQMSIYMSMQTPIHMFRHAPAASSL